jgi:ATP-dependent DNA helicase PIF1
MPVSLDPVAESAFHLMESSSDHVLLTGRAGTGKSTLLSYFRERTVKRVAVVAPTGVAAVNVGGQTIHSFFGLGIGSRPGSVGKPTSSRKKVLSNLDAVVIDEISMVRADLLDCMDEVLRACRGGGRPFGGVQLIMIGDLFQLPPVVPQSEAKTFSQAYAGPYFFHAKAWDQIGVQSVELSRVYRQEDPALVASLDRLRLGKMTPEDLAAFPARKVPVDELGVVRLTTTNAAAEAWNDRRLAELPGDAVTFVGSVTEPFPDERLPAPHELSLKVGAQVMLVANDREKRWVNGDVGVVRELVVGSSGPLMAVVDIAGRGAYDIGQHAWETFAYAYDETTKKLVAETAGSYRQIPLKLAWAVTVHKAQGKTFDKVAIDFGYGTFAPGQAYVALSRARSLEGISLARPLRAADVRVDPTVVEFSERLAAGEFAQARAGQGALV